MVIIPHRLLVNKAQGVPFLEGTCKKKPYVWLQEEQLHRKLRRPPDRNIEHIPPTELRAIVAAVTGALFGSGRKTLITEVARTLGFNRSGGRITEVLDKALQGLLNEGELVESFDMIHVTA